MNYAPLNIIIPYVTAADWEGYKITFTLDMEVHNLPYGLSETVTIIDSLTREVYHTTGVHTESPNRKLYIYEATYTASCNNADIFRYVCNHAFKSLHDSL